VANSEKHSRHVFFRTRMRVNNELTFVYDGNIQHTNSTVNGRGTNFLNGEIV